MAKEKPATKPSKLTVFGPHNNDVVNLNQPFPVTRQLTDQLVSGEPVIIDVRTVIPITANGERVNPEVCHG